LVLTYILVTPLGGGSTIATIHLPGSNLHFYLSPTPCSPPGFGASRGGKLQYFPPMGGTSKIVTYISDPLPLKTMAKRVGMFKGSADEDQPRK
jgi:hypothetical protein